jgi:hypothetical protein
MTVDIPAFGFVNKNYVNNKLFITAWNVLSEPAGNNTETVKQNWTEIYKIHAYGRTAVQGGKSTHPCFPLGNIKIVNHGQKHYWICLTMMSHCREHTWSGIYSEQMSMVGHKNKLGYCHFRHKNLTPFCNITMSNYNVFIKYELEINCRDCLIQ